MDENNEYWREGNYPEFAVPAAVLLLAGRGRWNRGRGAAWAQ